MAESPCVGVKLIYRSLRSRLLCFHWFLLLAFSLHCSSSCAFLRSLSTQFSHLCCGLPRFLEPSCFFVSALFGSLSSFIRTMCPLHFTRPLCQLYKLYSQLLLAGLSFSVCTFIELYRWAHLLFVSRQFLALNVQTKQGGNEDVCVANR